MLHNIPTIRCKKLLINNLYPLSTQDPLTLPNGHLQSCPAFLVSQNPTKCTYFFTLQEVAISLLAQANILSVYIPYLIIWVGNFNSIRGMHLFPHALVFFSVERKPLNSRTFLTPSHYVFFHLFQKKEETLDQCVVFSIIITPELLDKLCEYYKWFPKQTRL